MEEKISSARNPKIARLLALQQKSSERRLTGLFVVEGQREIERCKACGFCIECIFCTEEAMEKAHHLCSRVFPVTDAVYSKIAYRESTEGMVAEVHSINRTLSSLEIGANPLIAVLESVEKPGNLGAVLRSADAAGADAVIVCDPLTDLYNPNLLRASLGTAFSVPCVSCSSKEAIGFLKEKDIRILTAQLQDSSLYYECDMRSGVAIVMGTEATGLTEQWREAADAHIRIPMNGIADSLNVSVSAAILLFEALRQRQ